MSFQQTHGGYEINLLEDLPEMYTCPICSKLLRRPIQTARGERACESCYRTAVGDSSICPIDNQQIDIKKEIFMDRYLERTISELKCYCKNHKNGCTWKGSVREVENHEGDCSFILVTCERCEMSITKMEEKDHEKQCPEKEILCDYCKEKLIRRDYENHLITCKNGPKKCPYACGKTVEFSKLQSHLSTECKSIRNANKCPYSILGCKEPVTPTTLLKHLQEYLHIHTGYVIHSFITIQDENQRLRENLNTQCKEFKKLLDKEPTLTNETKKTSVLESVMNKYEEEFQDVKKKKKKTDEKVDELYRKHGETPIPEVDDIKEGLELIFSQYEEIETMISSGSLGAGNSNSREYGENVPSDLLKFSQEIEAIESRNAILSANTSDLENELRKLKNTSYNGEQIWKIDNILFRLRQATQKKQGAFHSAPVYTERGGYKFCSRIYLNGDGLGRDKYISLFIVIMKTEYDCLLEWPFKKKVTFELIHPRDQTLNITESFTPDPKSSSFQQPTREMNVAAGCPKFLLKDDLANKNFIIDDCIYIRTIVS